jgi:Xaa-Pro aminopeptidase
MSAQPRTETLLFAASDHDADAFYFSAIFVPDPFIAFTHRSRRIGLASQLEFARMCRDSSLDEVLPLEDWAERAKAQFGVANAQPADIIASLAAHYKIQQFRVSDSFPFGVACGIQARGLNVLPANGQLFPTRELKTDAEAAAIATGNKASVAGFKVVERMLKAATIQRGTLWLDGKQLTSERVRTAIEIACLERGAHAVNTIVAGGDQACDPHCRGSGPLRANQLIIVDIFPRVAATGYFGDMTRTYLKGTPSPAQVKLVETVLAAEQSAITRHIAGADGTAIYNEVCQQFVAAGFTTAKVNGVPTGFFHGLGHGLGLEVHEPPRVSRNGSKLVAGQVITVEPGLYYPGLGGCRFEDVVRVTDASPERLSAHPYRWLVK